MDKPDEYPDDYNLVVKVRELNHECREFHGRVKARKRELESKLADEVIKRLNDLIQDPSVRADIDRLFETRIKVCSETANHPTIQVMADDLGAACLGTLGLLNGILGAVESGPNRGCGRITAHYVEGALTSFTRTEETKTEEANEPAYSV